MTWQPRNQNQLLRLAHQPPRQPSLHQQGPLLRLPPNALRRNQSY
nr:MAG TPA: hypothetical protein [Caudoviricetes sp.]